MKKILTAILIAGTIAACGKGKETSQSNETSAKKQVTKKMSIEELTTAAKKEGRINSVGMPDGWANWKDTWKDLNEKYNLEHIDTDMSSAQEIAKFKSEGKNASADIGDVGFAFAPIAVQQGVTQPYKTSHWDDIPDWAKDKDGNWMLGYTGTIAFMVNKNTVKDIPRTWNDLLKGNYKIGIGDVGSAAQANSAVLAAALALGGDETNLKPALDLFAKLAKKGNLTTLDPSIANLEKGELQIGIMWDFNALNFRDKIHSDEFEVFIPQDGSLISGYATIINKNAKHPNAAKLAREFILSDKGQINLAKGYAKPIRKVKLPSDIQAKMLPNDQYKNVKPIKDFAVWKATAKQLPMLWQENVTINMK